MATVINFLSPFSQFDAYINKYIKYQYMVFGYNTKVAKIPCIPILGSCRESLHTYYILNIYDIPIKYIQWYVYIVCYIDAYIAGEYYGPGF